MLTAVNVTEEYKIIGTLREKRVRLLLKLNKDAYNEKERKEGEGKHLNKHRKSFAINYPYLDQEPSETSFRNSTVKSRTAKNVEKSLPQSIREQKKVIKSLASKFNVKIKLEQKVGRKKNVFSEQENQWLIKFLNQPDISYTIPERRDNIYLGKFGEVENFAQKYLKSLAEISCGQYEILRVR